MAVDHADATPADLAEYMTHLVAECAKARRAGNDLRLTALHGKLDDALYDMAALQLVSD